MMNSSMISHSHISRLNSRGAVALASGDDREALRSFKGVVAALGELTNMPGLMDDGELPFHPMLVSSLPLPDMKDERFFVYNEVLLYQWAHEVQVPSLADLYLCSVISLFNTALNHQRRAMRSSSGARSLFLAASRIYEHALNVANGLPEDNALVGSLKILICNNLAHIYHFELDAFEASLCHLERIKASIAAVNGGLLATDANSRDEIMLNVLLTKTPLTATSA